MKKLIISLILVLFVIIGCSTPNTETNADRDIPDSFILMEESKISHVNVNVIKHEYTGCYYTLSTYGQAVSIIQMNVVVDGKSVPYCENK